jgi:hypothetical protein
MPAESPRVVRAERLADYFELQLLFARHMAGRLGLALPEAVLRFTNFHRRFGYGDPDLALAPAWSEHAAHLAVLDDLPAQVAWAREFFLSAPLEALPAHQTFFGCFGCDAPDAQGMVRIHFTNADRDGSSPLSHAKIARRQADLRHVVGFIAERHSHAKSIKGISWLYNLDAYRRLFPPVYGASTVPAMRARMTGSSSWGQFLRHDETIRPELRDRFLQSFASVDPSAPWRSFPLPPLTAQAPFAAFVAFYGL